MTLKVVGTCKVRTELYELRIYMIASTWVEEDDDLSNESWAAPG